MRTWLAKLMSIVVIGSLLLTQASAVYAASPDIGSIAAQNAIAHNNAIALQYEQAIRELTPFVHRQTDGTFTIAAPNSIMNRIRPDALRTIEAGNQKVNSLILEGKLRSTSSLEVYDPQVPSYSIQGNLNQVVWQWWGVQIYLDNTNTQRLINAIGMGAGAVAIAGIIAGMVPGGQLIGGLVAIAGVVIGIGGYAIGYEDASGQGVVFNVMYYVPPIVWVNSQ